MDDGAQLHLGVEVGALVARARPLGEGVEVHLVLWRAVLGGDFLDVLLHDWLVALEHAAVARLKGLEACLEGGVLLDCLGGACLLLLGGLLRDGVCEWLSECGCGGGRVGHWDRRRARLGAFC